MLMKSVGGRGTKSLRDSSLRGRARLTGGRGNQFRGHLAWRGADPWEGRQKVTEFELGSLDFLIVFANLRISGEMRVDLRENGAHVRL